MPKLTAPVFIGIAVLTIIVSFFIYSTFKKQGLTISNPPLNTTTSTLGQDDKQYTASAGALPSDHPNMGGVTVTEEFKTDSTVYALNGDVDQYNEETRELTLRSKGAPLPIFRVAEDVHVVIPVGQSQSQTSSLSQIKSGSNITVMVKYDQKLNVWTVIHISLIKK